MNREEIERLAKENPLFRIANQDTLGLLIGRTDLLDEKTLGKVDAALRSGKGLGALDDTTRRLLRESVDDRAYERLEILGRQGAEAYGNFRAVEQRFFDGDPSVMTYVDSLVRENAPGSGLASEELRYRLVNSASGFPINAFTTGNPDTDFAASAYGALSGQASANVFDLERKLSSSVGQPLLAEGQCWTPGMGNKAAVEVGIIKEAPRRDPESGLWVPLRDGKKGYLTLEGQVPLEEGARSARSWGEIEDRNNYQLSRNTLAALQGGKVEGPAKSWSTSALFIGDEARERFNSTYAGIKPTLAKW